MDYDDLQYATEFLNRATVLRDELGHEAYRRAMRRALVALGDAVIDEAERLAQPLSLPRDGTVVQFTGRSRIASPRSAKRASDQLDQDDLKPAFASLVSSSLCARGPSRQTTSTNSRSKPDFTEPNL